MYVARCIRGIQEVVAAEVTERVAGHIVRTRHREVWFDSDAPSVDLAALRTVDDVFAVVAIARRIGRTRDALSAMSDAVLTAELDAPPSVSGIDVVASFLGKRNWNRYELEDAAGNAIAARTGLRYWSRGGGERPPAGAWSWRVTVEDDEAMIGTRIADRAVAQLLRDGDRGRVGALQPQLAAAMVRLAGTDIRVVLDPCAGLGTILDEARTVHPALVAVGGDLDPIVDYVGDAGRLPLATAAVDALVSNPPWGEQVGAAGSLASGPERFWSEAARVVRPGGTIVVLSTNAAVPEGAIEVTRTLPVSLRGSHPVLVVAVRR